MFNLSLLLILLAPAPLPQGGGDWETLHQFQGSAAFDNLGLSVSGVGDLNGDGYDDIIAGSYPGGGLWSPGAVTAYSGLDGAILHQWNGVGFGDFLGTAISGAGDVNGDGFADVIFSAPYTDIGPLQSAGSVFVYSGIDGSLLHQWDGTQSYMIIGSRVSGAGDVNADGFADLMFSVISDSPQGVANAGSVYIYSGLTGTLLHHFTGAFTNHQLGASLSSAGDIDHDGYDDVIVGGAHLSAGNAANGTATVYSGQTGLPIRHWTASQYGGHFGLSVSDAGDVDGDGTRDQIVGAPFGGIEKAGIVSVFSGATGALIFQLTGEHAQQLLGNQVSSAGDVNQDGHADLLATSGMTSWSYTNEYGSVSCYSGKDGSLLHMWTESPADDFLAASISAAGDVNNDGIDDIVFGARRWNQPGIADSGSVWVYAFHPLLHADVTQVSAASGGTVNLTLNFPQAAAGQDFKVLFSASGVGPTTYGVDIPLTHDAMVVDTFQGNYPVPSFSNLHGTLNGSGHAQGFIDIPTGLSASLIGRTFWCAAVASPPGQLPTFSSVAIPIEITP